MAVRVIALLIPLAIVVPQLQTQIDPAPSAQAPSVQAQQAPWPLWSYDTRRAADTAFTRVELESPLYSAVHTVANPVPDPVTHGPANPARRKAPAQRVAHAPTRLATPKASVSAAGRAVTPAVLPAVYVCQPQTHCAPVVVARQTPVPRRSL